MARWNPSQVQGGKVGPAAPSSPNRCFRRCLKNGLLGLKIHLKIHEKSSISPKMPNCSWLTATFCTNSSHPGISSTELPWCWCRLWRLECPKQKVQLERASWYIFNHFYITFRVPTPKGTFPNFGFPSERMPWVYSMTGFALRMCSRMERYSTVPTAAAANIGVKTLVDSSISSRGSVRISHSRLQIYNHAQPM